jgi:hypothetical protein
MESYLLVLLEELVGVLLGFLLGGALEEIVGEVVEFNLSEVNLCGGGDDVRLVHSAKRNTVDLEGSYKSEDELDVGVQAGKGHQQCE